jgi:hypothetical protein
VATVPRRVPVAFFMAKTKSNTTDSAYTEVLRHYQTGFDETDRRRIGKGRIGSISFDEADELFRSWLDEKNWPYDALLFDPRVFTFIFEKTARLLGSKLKGTLVPREGGDVLGAKVNNAILDLQWDQANHGGSMLQKWALMDINTRKYGASFGLCRWRYEVDKKGKPMFDGPEMQVLNNRDCAHDGTSNAIESCNWFQVREYVTIQSLQRINDAARNKPIYENLDRLLAAVQVEDSPKGGDSRDSNWISRNRTISGLTASPIGQDPVFKTIEIVTEYRRDEWITFAPRHGVVIRRIDNPYDNFEIPVTMLRYYPIDDDLYGLSEIEPIKGLQKGINAILCQYVDEINQKLYSPIAVGPGVRQHTLQWGKGARWLMNNPMTDFRVVESSSNAAAFFNNTYSALVAAMMNALGETSLGVSNIDRYQSDKTATEVKQLMTQRNARDNFNQMFLGEAIERQMQLWYSMNQKMIFADPKKKYFVLRVVGKDAIDFYQNYGLDKMGVTQAQVDYVNENPEADINKLGAPTHGVDLGDGQVIPKFKSLPGGEGALYVTPEDLMGMYDYIADVKAMGVSASEDEKGARDKAITALLSNPNVLSFLNQEGVKPKFKELFVNWLEDAGFKDADKFFENAPAGQPMPGAPGQPPQMPGQPGRPPQVGGMTPPPGNGMQIPNPNINLNTVNPQEVMHLANPEVIKQGGAVGPSPVMPTA